MQNEQAECLGSTEDELLGRNFGKCKGNEQTNYISQANGCHV